MALAYTEIADVISPEVLADQVGAKFPDKLVLGGSSMVEVDTTFPLGSPGTEFKMPFWKRIGLFGALTEGTAMVPGKITAGAEYATVQRAGAAYEVYDTAELVSKSDPVGEIAGQIARRAAEYIDAALVTEMEKTPNTHDQTGETSPTVDPDVIATAMISTLGDNYASLLSGGAMIMHSKVYGDLLKLDAIQNQYQSGMDVLRTGTVPTIMGLPIIISDRVTKTNVASASDAAAYVSYQTYLVGPGALALFYQRNVSVEFDRDILLLADIIAANVHFAAHLFGYDDKTSAVKAEDNKSIHVVNITSK